jgi:hypothetical protein
VQVDGVDRGSTGGEVLIGAERYEWRFRHPDHARWAFDVLELPRNSWMPERPPLRPLPEWLRWLADD